jgi:hypothetical protein
MRMIKKVISDVFIECTIIFMQAIGKGLIKFSKQYRRRNKVSIPKLASSKSVVKTVGLKK